MAEPQGAARHTAPTPLSTPGSRQATLPRRPAGPAQTPVHTTPPSCGIDRKRRSVYLTDTQPCALQRVCRYSTVTDSPR